MHLRIPFARTKAPKETPIPIGCAPNYITTGNRSFGGIVLDDALKFECAGQRFEVPFDFVQRLSMGRAHPFIEELHLSIGLVDGSAYEAARIIEPTKIQLASVGGVQSVEFKLVAPTSPRYSGPAVKFNNSKVSDVAMLRDRLTTALSLNKHEIAQQLGANTLQTVFNLSSIS